jgi:hypothetical protein
MWELEATEEFGRRQKRYEKKHPRELVAVLDNLDTYFKAIQSGLRPRQINFGFVHLEPNGAIAIDQRGGGTNLAQTRLYVYANEDTCTLTLVTLGDKRSQTDDISVVKRFIAELRKKGK